MVSARRASQLSGRGLGGAPRAHTACGYQPHRTAAFRAGTNRSASCLRYCCDPLLSTAHTAMPLADSSRAVQALLNVPSVTARGTDIISSLAPLAFATGVTCIVNAYWHRAEPALRKATDCVSVGVPDKRLC